MTIQEQALKHFGTRHQLIKCAEEAAELAAAINRYLNDPSHYESVIEEAADVENCAPYLRAMFGDHSIDKAKAAKLERLAETIGGKG